MMIEEETWKDRQRECIERVTRSKDEQKGSAEKRRRRKQPEKGETSQERKQPNSKTGKGKVGAGNSVEGASISMKSIAKGETDGRRKHSRERRRKKRKRRVSIVNLRRQRQGNHSNVPSNQPTKDLYWRVRRDKDRKERPRRDEREKWERSEQYGQQSATHD